MSDNSELIARAREAYRRPIEGEWNPGLHYIHDVTDALEAAEAENARLKADHTDSEKALIDQVNGLLDQIDAVKAWRQKAWLFPSIQTDTLDAILSAAEGEQDA